MIWLLLIFFIPGGLNISTDMDYITVYPCGDNTNISAVMKSPNPNYPDYYNLIIPIPSWGYDMILRFNTKTTLEVEPEKTISIVNDFYDSKVIHIKFLSGIVNVLNFKILIPRGKYASYVQSIRLNQNHQLCEHPKTGYFHNLQTQKSTVAPYIVSSTMSNASKKKTNAPYIVTSTMSNAPEKQADAPNIVSSTMSNAVFSFTPSIFHSEEFSPDESCGKQKVVHTELIVHGQSANSGQWPWHAAIFRIEQHSLRYICGGTLLSKTLVLTAAHCASIRGSPVVPEALKVHLGKINLFGDDIAAQVREVFRVIVHPKFDGFTLDNDLALLKLKSEAAINNYVRPACLWYEQANLKFPTFIFGTIAGWGFDHNDLLTSTLRQITIPIVPELGCLKSNPTFFHKKLNDNKFCGGFANGTSVCNGDSGGGFMVFVPDAPGTATGAWYVRGIVSLAPSRTDAYICDPYEYTIFTDVEKYRDWLLEYVE